MWLQQLTVENCRLIERWELELAPQVNIFTGGNASGKSSFIEALCILSRGRSFRTAKTAEVLRHGSETLRVSGRIREETAHLDYPLGIAKTLTTTHIRINHADVYQQAELSRHLPLTVMHPDTIDLLTGAPAGRRALLDWIAFYREPDFHLSWRDYQRVLRQRNACLRDPQQHYALSYWTAQLIRLQPRIHQFRNNALLALQAALQQLTELFTYTGKLGLKLLQGFPLQVNVQDSSKLAAFFQERQEQEIRQGFSLYGAHRADLQITLDDQLAAQVASRGQLKLLGIALLLAQSEAITNEDTKRGIIAIDDLASELDNNNQQLLYQVLRRTRQQLIITGTRQPPEEYLPADSRLFHVEQGRIVQ